MTNFLYDVKNKNKRSCLKNQVFIIQSLPDGSQVCRSIDKSLYFSSFFV